MGELARHLQRVHLPERRLQDLIRPARQSELQALAMDVATSLAGVPASILVHRNGGLVATLGETIASPQQRLGRAAKGLSMPSSLRLRWPSLSVLVVFAACQCRPERTLRADPVLISSPRALVLPSIYVGQESTAAITLANVGLGQASAAVSIGAPFSADITQIELAGGHERVINVRFTSLEANHFSATLTVGDLSIPVEGTAVDIPTCEAPHACVSTHFDLQTAQCVATPRPEQEGAACESRCVMGGACAAGDCTGQFRSCDDSDACTVDACSHAVGCTHTFRVCTVEPSSCQVARCDSALGCVTEEAPDGTVCGVDDCRSSEIDVCILGRCVRRPRPVLASCRNTWEPVYVPPMGEHALAYDAANKRTVLFGGSVGTKASSETWLWDGLKWTLRNPPAFPPPRTSLALAYDAARQRTVLFGGYGESAERADTWEWDGSTWLATSAPVSPPARFGHAMAYDAARQRVILFGGRGNHDFSDTWEWNGRAWAQLAPTNVPKARSWHSMAYDSSRKRVVLFGGSTSSGYLADTWEWDGNDWTEVRTAQAPSPRSSAGLAYDSARQRVILFAGYAGSGPLADTWEWDGTAWQKRNPLIFPMARQSAVLAYDDARARVVLFGGTRDGAGHSRGDTWEWDGSTWAQRDAANAPEGRSGFSLNYEVSGERSILFGGTTGGFAGEFLDNETWCWDGTVWAQLLPSTSPPHRAFHASAYDAARQRTVIFGGRGFVTTHRNDTWEFDGNAWAERITTTVPPARYQGAMTYDAYRQRAVLFGGDGENGARLADTWEWDGTSWVERSPANSPPARRLHALTYDRLRKRTVLFGGQGENPQLLADTWEWDGTDWRELKPVSTPHGRVGHRLAYDEDRQRVVLFGGEYDALANYQSDTWEWDGVNWQQLMPVQVPGGRSQHGLVYDAARKRLTTYGGHVAADTWRYVP